MTDIALVCIGAIIGILSSSIVSFLADQSDKRKMEDSLVGAVLEDIDQLLSEIDQHGFEVYRREGVFQMRKKRKVTKK